MTGDLKSKLLLLVVFVSLGIAIRFGFKHWGQERHIASVDSTSHVVNHNNSKVEVNFSNICMGLEQNSTRDKKLKPEQTKFLQSTSASFCYCMSVQMAKSKVLSESLTNQVVTKNYLTFLKSERGQKIYEYCNQVAKYEANRKSGRGIAALPPPPKAAKSVKK